MTTKQFNRLLGYHQATQFRQANGLDMPKPSRAKAKSHSIGAKESQSWRKRHASAFERLAY